MGRSGPHCHSLMCYGIYERIKMKLYTDTGFLSQHGEMAFSMFLDKEVAHLLNAAKTESELRVIGSLICKRVQDKVSDRVSDLKKE